MSTLEPPPLNAPIPTLADWVELQTLNSSERQTHDSDLIAIGQIEDERGDDDSIEADERLESLAEGVFTELDRRARAAKGPYPFRLNLAGTTLALREGDGFTDGEYTYLFCLLVSEYRRHQLIPRVVFGSVADDIEDLFQVCSTVAAAGLLRGMAVSFGFPRPDGSGFLTALKRTFEQQMREGRAVPAPRPGVSSDTKDGGIDIIAWRDFPDGLPSKLYLLGQCASGDRFPEKSVGNFLANFHGDWFTDAPGSRPIEALFIPFMLDQKLVVRRTESHAEARAGHYLSRARNLGIIVDRCRMAVLAEEGAAIAQEKPGWVERAPELERVRAWVEEVRHALAEVV